MLQYKATSLKFEKKITDQKTLKGNIGGHGEFLGPVVRPQCFHGGSQTGPSWELRKPRPQVTTEKEIVDACLQVQVCNYNLKRQKCHKHTHTPTSERPELGYAAVTLVLLSQAETVLPLEQG